MLEAVKKSNRKKLRYRRNDIVVNVHQKKSEPVQAKLVNISQHGVALILDMKLKVNTLVFLRLTFPSGEEFLEQGHVVGKSALLNINSKDDKKGIWKILSKVAVDQYEYRLEFNNVAPEFKNFLLASNTKIRLGKLTSK